MRKLKRKIIAIGGGRIMLPKSQAPQTLSIDREIVRLTNRKKPRLLFVPTASLDDADYCQRVQQHFAGRLGCQVDNLLLYRERPAQAEIRRRILAADIIYVGGGNTLRMMMLWRSLGVDRLMDSARKRGTVLAGLSAGCICWFRQGNSDSRKFADASNNTLIKVSGLNYVDALVCPHYDVEKHRQPALKTMMRSMPGIAIALDNGAAMEIVDNSYRIITSMGHKNGWRVYWHRGEYRKEKLVKDGGFLPLKLLLDKTSPQSHQLLAK